MSQHGLDPYRTGTSLLLKAKNKQKIIQIGQHPDTCPPAHGSPRAGEQNMRWQGGLLMLAPEQSRSGVAP